MGKALYRVDEEFFWLKEEEFKKMGDNCLLVATVEDFYGEDELDFAEEYLLDYGNDEIVFFIEEEDEEDVYE